MFENTQALIRVWRPFRGTLIADRSDHNYADEKLLERVASLERQLVDLHLEADKLRSTIKVQELEIKLLVGVNERNQTRIESETAELAQRIAMATAPPVEKPTFLRS